jgi:hypothetical protein
VNSLKLRVLQVEKKAGISAMQRAANANTNSQLQSETLVEIGTWTLGLAPCSVLMAKIPHLKTPAECWSRWSADMWFVMQCFESLPELVGLKCHVIANAVR